MKASLLRFGHDANPVVLIDQATSNWEKIAQMAACLAPFPASRCDLYPGVRHHITDSDCAASNYVSLLVQSLAPFIGGAFQADAFDLVEASFSIVTQAPERLKPEQKAPHFDSCDLNLLAILHYLNPLPDSGTAFYRQRETRIETVSVENEALFEQTARAHSARLAARGYLVASDEAYEQIGQVSSVPDRVVIYRGAALHSGLISPGAGLSADPRQGRLTANIFVRLKIF